jgi:hypothetical protein
MIFSLGEERTVSNKTLIGIRELRRLSGWTQTGAARASSINHARISMAESCEIQLTAEEELRLRRALLAEIRTRAYRIECVLAETKFSQRTGQNITQLESDPQLESVSTAKTA